MSSRSCVPVADPTLDHLTRLATRLTGAPGALLTLVDGERQVVVSAHGVPAALAGMRDIPPAHGPPFGVTGAPGLIVVEDARLVQALAESGALRDSGVVAYVAVPVCTTDGATLGTLTVVDTRPRSWDDAVQADLAGLAALAGAGLELHRRLATQAHTAEALRVSEERLRLTLESAGDGLWDAHVPSGVAYYSPGWARMLGYTPEEIAPTYESWAHAVHPEDWPAVAALAEAHLRGETPAFDHELRLRRKDGGWTWVRCRAKVVERDAEGGPVRMVGIHNDITPRREAERARATAEARFRALIEHAQDVVGILAPDGTILYESPAIERVLGFHPGELVGRPAADFVHPDDLPVVTATLARIVSAPRAVTTARYRARHRDGGWRILDAQVWNVLDEPAVGGIVVNARDVTEHAAAEAALRESQARLDDVAANVPGMVYQFAYRGDGTAGYTFVSDAAQRLFDVDPTAAVRDPEALLRLLHPDERSSFVAEARAAAAALAPVRWEGRVVLPDGAERVIQVAARARRAPDGGVFSDGVVLDVTEWRQASRQLAESEARLRLALELAGLAVWERDLATGALRDVASGPDARASLRVDSMGDYEGFLARVHPEDRERVHRTNVEAVAGGGAFTVEFRTIEPPGTVHWNQAILRGLVDGDGHPTRMLGVARDVTAQHELEAQLRQAQKMEAVGQLAGGVAHDFNNLLQVIQSAVAFVADELPPDAVARADLEEIRQAGERAQELTAQLLAFGRRQVLRPRRADVNRKVENVVRMLRRIVGEDIAVVTTLADEPWPVYADPGQLEQVLMNLAVNGRDAMPDGGTLRLSTTNVEVAAARQPTGATTRVPPGAYVALAVEDTGTGIEPAVLPHIFEPFVTTKPVGKGTGLGLSTVHGIVAQSGGYICVESAPGRGSRLTVLLPRLLEPASVDPGSTAAASLPRGTETVLLVEDEAPVRGVVRRLLERQGYTVLEAAGGAAALQLAGAAPRAVDLVLTDVVMPGQNGRTLVEALRARWPSLRVLYMSGYPDDEILQRGIAKPGTALLSKPFSPASLARAVREALDARSSGS